MDGDPGNRLRQHLLPDETITWIGRPETAVIALCKVPFALFALAFTGALLWLVAPNHQMPPPSALWPPSPNNGMFLFFGGIGLLLASGPLTAAWAASRTVYATTEQRALVLRGGKLWAFPGGNLPGVVRYNRMGGVSDLVFQPPLSTTAGVHLTTWKAPRPVSDSGGVQFGKPPPAGFYAIRRPDTAEASLQRLLRIPATAPGQATLIAPKGTEDAGSPGDENIRVRGDQPTEPNPSREHAPASPWASPELRGFVAALLVGIVAIYLNLWLLAPVTIFLLWRNRFASGALRLAIGAVLTLPHIVVAACRYFMPGIVIEVEPSTLATSAHQWAFPYFCLAVAALLLWSGGLLGRSRAPSALSGGSGRWILGGFGLTMIAFSSLLAANLNDDFERVEIMPNGHWRLVQTFRGTVADVTPNQVVSITGRELVSGSSRVSSMTSYREVVLTLADGRAFKVDTRSARAMDAVAALNRLRSKASQSPQSQD